MPFHERTTIAALVRPDHLERALKFLDARAGNQVTPQIHDLAYRARKIASRVGLSDQGVARLEEILAHVKGVSPSGRGLTHKNRSLLEHVEDSRFVDRLLTLPARLMQAAITARRGGASYARDAVAVELLLFCTMRPGNLADLRLGETIRKFGQGRDARWVIDLPAEQVKNCQPLRYELLPESGGLIEHYLENWHDAWCGPGSDWHRLSLQRPYRRVRHLARPALDSWIETTWYNTSDLGAFAVAGGLAAGRRRAATARRRQCGCLPDGVRANISAQAGTMPWSPAGGQYSCQLWPEMDA